jgi:hypothetical protein
MIELLIVLLFTTMALIFGMVVVDPFQQWGRR